MAAELVVGVQEAEQVTGNDSVSTGLVLSGDNGGGVAWSAVVATHESQEHDERKNRSSLAHVAAVVHPQARRVVRRAHGDGS
jgi:hypothetical protein